MKDITVKELQDKLKKYNKKNGCTYWTRIYENYCYLVSFGAYVEAEGLDNIIAELDSVNEPEELTKLDYCNASLEEIGPHAARYAKEARDKIESYYKHKYSKKL